MPLIGCEVNCMSCRWEYLLKWRPVTAKQGCIVRRPGLIQGSHSQGGKENRLGPHMLESQDSQHTDDYFGA